MRFACLFIAAVTLCMAVPAWALDGSKSPAGSNHAAAHTLATGDGIRVGVIEAAGADTDHTSIDNDGRLIKNLNFVGTTGPITTEPPAASTFHAHPTRVSDVIGSSHATYTGVAPGSHLYVAAINDSTTIFNSIDYYYRANDVGLFNLSLGFGDNNAGANKLSQALDYHMQTFDTLMVKSAGNTGVDDQGSQISSPGDFYNGLTVGALDVNFTARLDYSSYLISGESGSTVNYWPKPEVVAPGAGLNWEGYSTTHLGTSYAAPHVAGIAALLQEGTPTTDGLTLGAEGGANHLAIKAIVMNSSRKRNIVGPENDYPYAADHANTAADLSDGDYLNGGTFRAGASADAPKTAPWTPSSWSYTDGVFSTAAPLDDELGTGAVDAVRSLTQLDGGQQGPGSVSALGWDTNTLAANTPNDYSLGFHAGGSGEFLTITLTWDRLIDWSDAGNEGLDYADTFTAQTLPNLDLQVFFQNELYAESVSLFNSEHLHIPLMQFGNPNDYMIRVLPTADVSDTTYALAWWTVPEPATLGLLALGGLALIRRRRAA